MILDELKEIAGRLDEQQVEALKNKIKSADRIFLAGAGRSRLMISCLTMRLMQTGYTAYLVGEVVTPAIKEGDLLIIASGSGRTGSLLGMAKKAKETGAELGLITINSDSPIGALADAIVCIDAATTKNVSGEKKASVQPGASSFEQSVLLLGDALILELMAENRTLEEGNKGLMELHANLE